MIVSREVPLARAASMNSFSFSARVCARTTRATPAQPTRASAMKMLKRFAPSVYITTMASSSDGKAIIMSASRMTTKSVRPPT